MFPGKEIHILGKNLLQTYDNGFLIAYKMIIFAGYMTEI